MTTVRCGSLVGLVVLGCGPQPAPAGSGRVASQTLVGVLRWLWPDSDWTAVTNLQPGESCAFTIQGNGVRATSSGGTIPTIRLDGEPGPILDALGPRLDEMRRWAADELVAIGPGGTVTGSSATRLCKEVLEVARQIDYLRLWVQATDPSGADFDAELHLTPRRGTWLELVVKTMGRSATLVPVPPDDGHSTVLRVASLNHSLIQTLQSWQGSPLAALPHRLADVLGRLLQLPGNQDHTPEGAWLFDPAGGLRSIIRSSDRAELERLLSSLQTTPLEPAPAGNASTQASGADFEHRGLRVIRQRIGLGESRPGSTAWHALAGEWLLMGSDPQALRALVDDALDGRLRASPLPHAAVFELRIPLSDAARNTALPLPARLLVSVGRDATGLVVRVRAG
jgi:hypothetical protein